MNEHISVWALGSIVPTAGLVFAVHLMAYAALFSGHGLATAETVAAVFLVISLVGYYVVVKRYPQNPAPEDRPGDSPPERSPRLLQVPVLVVTAMYIIFLVDALTRYPTGYDGRHYHLPLAVTWMQTGSLDLVVGFMHRSLPENAMIIPMLLFSARLERLVTLINVPNGLLLAGLVYGLTGTLGVGRGGGIAAVCVALSIPIVVFQSFSSYIDLYSAVTWLGALLALTWAGRAADDRKRRSLLVLAGLAGGLALGCKSTFLVLIPLLGMVAMAVEWIRPQDRRVHSLHPLRNVVLFGVATLICSGFWFVRGAVRADNPLYPVGVKIGDREILPGFTGDDWFPRRSLQMKVGRWWDYPWTETKYAGTGDIYGVNNGLGAAYATFVPVGVLAAFLATVTRRPREAMQKWRVVYLLLVLTGVVLLLTVFHEVPRYILPQILVAVPLAALLIDRLIARFPRLTIILLTLTLVTTAAVAALSPTRSFLGRVRDHTWGRAAFYQIPSFIDDFAPGTRILNLAQPPMTYPLLGRQLANEVISGPHWAVLLDGETISAEILHKHHIDYIYVREPWPDDWPDDLPAEKVYDDSETRRLLTTPATRVYRVDINPNR